MTRYLAVLAAAMLAACSGGKDTDATGDTGGTPGDDDDACENSVVTRFPVSGDTDVFYKTDVRFTLSDEEPEATIMVMDDAGAEVAGQTTVEGTLVTWDGAEDLTPSTAYTATLSYSCGDDAISFTTSNTGPATEVDLTGRVYALDLAGGDWVEPPGVGPLLSSQLGDTQVLVSPLAVDATTITMIGAIGSADVQDLCSPTLPFPPADWADPYFSLSSPLLPLVVAGFTIEIQDLDLSGAFAPDGSRIQGAALKGNIDTRPLGEVFGLEATDNAVCQLVATFGVACEECGDGEPYCLSVYIDAVEAGYINGGVIVPRTDIDIAADPACK